MSGEPQTPPPEPTPEPEPQTPPPEPVPGPPPLKADATPAEQAEYLVNIGAAKEMTDEQGNRYLAVPPPYEPPAEPDPEVVPEPEPDPEPTP